MPRRNKVGVRFRELIDDYNQNMPIGEILEKYGINTNSLYYHLRRQDEREPGSIRWRVKAKWQKPGGNQ